METTTQQIKVRACQNINTAADLNEAYFRNLAASMFWLMRREEKYSDKYALFKEYFKSYRTMSSSCCAATLRTLKRSMSSNASPAEIDEAMEMNND